MVKLKIERLGRDRLRNLSLGLLSCSGGGRKQNEIAIRLVLWVCVCVLKIFVHMLNTCF